MATISMLVTPTVGAFLGGLGVGELILILVIVLIIFGAGKLPQIGDALGKGIRNFRKASRTAEEEREVPAEPIKELPETSVTAGEPIRSVETHEAAQPAKKTT